MTIVWRRPRQRPPLQPRDFIRDTAQWRAFEEGLVSGRLREQVLSLSFDEEEIARIPSRAPHRALHRAMDRRLESLGMSDELSRVIQGFRAADPTAAWVHVGPRASLPGKRRARARRAIV